MKPDARLCRGFTMIELVIAVAIAAILLTLAAPSFRGFLGKKRVEGVATELSTDLQYARSEAIARNATVRVTFGAGCYVITQQPDGSSPSSTCSQTGSPTLGTGAVTIKQLQLQSGSTASFSGAPGWVEFDPVRGMAITDTANAGASIDVVSSLGGWQMRNTVTLLGKVNLCSPNATVSGFPSC